MKRLQHIPTSHHGKQIVHKGQFSVSSPISMSAEGPGSRWGKRILLVCVIVLTVLLGTLFLGPIKQSFANTTLVPNCRTALLRDKQVMCTGVDPYEGGCTFDAATGSRPDTSVRKPITYKGRIIGLVELRRFKLCSTYWGRGTSYIQGSHLHINLPILGSDNFYESVTSSVYSDMVYVPPDSGSPPPVVVVTMIVPDLPTVTTTIP